MTPLDDALTELRNDMDNPKCQSKFYDLFLNTTFFVPTLEDDMLPEEAAKAKAQGQVAPLIIESDGNDYLLIFDTVERLKAWAKKDVSYVEVPGHVLAATSVPLLHWALNVETEFAKPFIPDEIAWLKEVVEQCNEAAKKEQAADEK